MTWGGVVIKITGAGAVVVSHPNRILIISGGGNISNLDLFVKFLPNK